MRAWTTWTLGLAMAPAMAACGSSASTGAPPTDAQFQEQVTQGMHDSLQMDLDALVTSAKTLQAAAPDHPWDATDPAVPMMEAAWIDARHAYEHVEGATAPVFPDIDISIDGRVEDFGPDPGLGVLTTNCNVFSGLDPSTNMPCFTGLHAAERIMYVNSVPAAVIAYEQGLGFVPPLSFPKTQQNADDFKNELAPRAVSDAMALKSGWQPAVIDIGSAFQGLVALMNEQKEKVTKAGLDQEESRYSQRTMDDLRQNLAGTANIYKLFQPWIKSKDGGDAIDAKIESGFNTLSTLYDSAPYAGVAFPAPPAGWDETNPSAADLQTPFGQLFHAVQSAVDPVSPDSVVSQMNAAAALCGLPQFSES